MMSDKDHVVSAVCLCGASQWLLIAVRNCCHCCGMRRKSTRRILNSYGSLGSLTYSISSESPQLSLSSRCAAKHEKRYLRYDAPVRTVYVDDDGGTAHCIELESTQAQTVHDLKEAMSAQLECAARAHRIEFGGREVGCKCKLRALGLRTGSTVRLRIRDVSEDLDGKENWMCELSIEEFRVHQKSGSRAKTARNSNSIWK